MSGGSGREILRGRKGAPSQSSALVSSGVARAADQERRVDADREQRLVVNLVHVRAEYEVVVGRAVDCGLPRQVLDKPDLTLEEINPIPALLMPPAGGSYYEEVHVAPTGPDYLNFESAANSAVHVPAVPVSSPPSTLGPTAEPSGTIHFGNIAPLIR